METQSDAWIALKHESDIRRTDMLSMRNTQIACVLNILQKAIERFKISLMFPKLLEKPNHLKSVLIGTQHEPAIAHIDNYINHRDAVVKKQIPPLSDHGMIKIIDYFQLNHDIAYLFPNLLDKMSTNERELLKTFENLCNICKLHVLCGAKKYIHNEQRIYKLYHENETVKQNIKDFLTQFAKKRARQRWQRAFRALYLKRCQQEFDYQKEENENRMLNEGYQCKRVIRENRKSCLDKQIVLEEELKALQIAWANEETEHKKIESKQREEKNKVQYQLAAIIKRYDSTIKDKMIQTMDIDKELCTANSDLHKLTKIHDKVLAIYERVVLKYEEQAKRSQQDRILKFMMDLAALKIQRYWRKWRKQLRKKLLQEKQLKNNKLLKRKIKK